MNSARLLNTFLYVLIELILQTYNAKLLRLTLALIRSGHAAEWLYYYELHIYKNISNFTFKLKNLASSVCWKYHLSQNFIFSPLGNFLRMRNSPIYYMWELFFFFRSFSTLNFSHASQFRKWQMYHLSGVIYCTKTRTASKKVGQSPI